MLNLGLTNPSNGPCSSDMKIRLDHPPGSPPVASELGRDICRPANAPHIPGT